MAPKGWQGRSGGDIIIFSCQSHHWRCRSDSRRPRPQNIRRLRRLNEVLHHEDCHCLIYCTVSAEKYPPVHSQVRSAVAGDVSCPDVAALQKHNPCRHSAVSTQATSVGDELCCLAGVHIVVVWSHLSTPLPAELVEGNRAKWFLFTCLVYKCQYGAALSYFADELSQPADFEAWCCLRSASSPSLIVCDMRLSTIGDWAFPVNAACVWNSLPQHITSATSLSVFHSHLKTHLIRRCFASLHPP